MKHCCDIGNSSVIDSRPTTKHRVRRRRVCNYCGDRWTTFEISKKKYDRFTKMFLTLFKLTEEPEDE